MDFESVQPARGLLEISLRYGSILKSNVFAACEQNACATLSDMVQKGGYWKESIEQNG